MEKNNKFAKSKGKEEYTKHHAKKFSEFKREVANSQRPARPASTKRKDKYAGISSRVYGHLGNSVNPRIEAQKQQREQSNVPNAKVQRSTSRRNGINTVKKHLPSQNISLQNFNEARNLQK